MKSVLFMKPLKFGGRNVFWPEHEVEALLSYLLSEPNQDQIRDFVSKLHERRKSEGEQV